MNTIYFPNFSKLTKRELVDRLTVVTRLAYSLIQDVRSDEPWEAHEPADKLAEVIGFDEIDYRVTIDQYAVDGDTDALLDFGLTDRDIDRLLEDRDGADARLEAHYSEYHRLMGYGTAAQVAAVPPG